MHGHVWYLLTPLVLPPRGPRAGLPMGLSSAPSEGLCSTGRNTRALPWKFCSSGYIYNFFLACIWRSVRRQAHGCSRTPWYPPGPAGTEQQRFRSGARSWAGFAGGHLRAKDGSSRGLGRCSRCPAEDLRGAGRASRSSSASGA